MDLLVKRELWIEEGGVTRRCREKQYEYAMLKKGTATW